MWIELKRPTDINGVPRQPGYRIDYPRMAAVELISSGTAEGVDGPHEGRSDAGYPVGTNPPETTRPEEDDAVQLDETSSDDPEPPSAPVEAIDFTAIDGVGETTGGDIEGYFDEEGIERLSVDDDLEQIPYISDERAEKLKTLIREASGGE